MSPSKTKTDKHCCHLNPVITILALVAVGWAIITSNPEHKTENEEWLEKGIQEVHAVNADELYSQPAYLSANKLNEELRGVLFEKKRIEHDSLRGIYITAETAASENFPAIIEDLVQSGGNAVVMDVELSGGQLAFIPENAYLTSINPGSSQLAHLQSLIQALHRKDIYVIARQVIFNDPFAAARKPEWRIKYKGGELFDSRWLDPSNPEVQDYNLITTREVAKLGFDEIQYDYIRFPAENHYILDYHYDESSQERWEVINEFLKKAKTVTDEYGIKLGVDVFGATIWGNIDWDDVGQYIPEIAKSVDVIYPMTYPSHVSLGYYGFGNPYGNPYPFIQGTIAKFIEAANGNAEIRTWVQGFPLRIPNFGSWFMEEQVRGTYDAGANDFIIWSPGNKYEVSWSSLGMIPPELIEKSNDSQQKPASPLPSDL